MRTLDVLAWIHIVDRKLLAVRSRGRDAWYLPGGKREPGEDDTQALTREILEELGVALLAASLRHYAVVEDAAHGFVEPTRVRMACYFGEQHGEPAPCAEIEALCWLGAADAAHCAPAARQVLQRLHADGLID